MAASKILGEEAADAAVAGGKETRKGVETGSVLARYYQIRSEQTSGHSEKGHINECA